MSADKPAPLEMWRDITAKLFPWLVGITYAPDGGLSIRAAASKLLHLAGDAADPRVARVGDLVVRVWCVLGSGGIATLYVSGSTSAPYDWTGVPVSASLPLSTDAGTPITIAAGSSKVTCG